ncbi:cytidine deaminase [Desulfofundulus luciae]|uniref:Cytidine deaminase n=1 Tax=Desulfofundulus luciae TaxID=74702 RepID=A0ABU0B190_9FIRM|nr:cytidine deaminase [Desulfofundulus luciae]MDQ0286489.1 cytidine deaminase [Desulfofundulus luciae]
MIDLPVMQFPVEKLINTARASRERAYAPYSGFRVGAAILTSEGRLYTGCNIENASYGLTVCAERVALFKAVSNGERHFAALAVISDSEDYCTPCGACRQVLAEFGNEIKVYMCNHHGEYIVKTLAELLPLSFKLKAGEAGKIEGSPRPNPVRVVEPVDR